MMEETEDPTTWITSRDGNKIYYENSDGRTWWIDQQCTACGECESFPENFVAGMTINQVNTRVLADGTIEEWTRVLVWNSAPGTPGACVEQDYQLRKDLPLTPDLAGTGSCTLIGEWTN